MPPRAIFLLVVVVAAGCAARLPAPAAEVDRAIVDRLVEARLDTLGLRPRDFLVYTDSAQYNRAIALRDSLLNEGWEGSDVLELHRRIVDLYDPDSLEAAYRLGVSDATDDLRAGDLRSKVYGLPGVVRYDGDDTAWCTLSVYRSILLRDYRVSVDQVAGDVIEGNGPVAYAAGYNRVAEPVIAAYWGVADVWDAAHAKLDLYIRELGPENRAEWTSGC